MEYIRAAKAAEKWGLSARRAYFMLRGENSGNNAKKEIYI